MDPVTGEQVVDIDGQKYTMRFTWKVLSEIEHKYGDSPNMFDPEIIATIASGGLRARHPELTPDRVMELSPPLVPFANAVQEAIQWAYFGPTKPDTGPVKKNPTVVGYLRRIAQAFRQGYRPSNSGS